MWIGEVAVFVGMQTKNSSVAGVIQKIAAWLRAHVQVLGPHIQKHAT